MIDFSGVTIQLDAGKTRNVILDNASVVLPTDRKLALLGHHGCGKSTVIQAIAGMIAPVEGRISRYARVSFPVGFAGGFNPALTLRQNLRHLATLYGADVQEITEFIVQVSITDQFLDEKLSTVPREIRSNFCFAAGYAIPFDVYLFDNHIAVGDPGFRERCFAMWHARAQNSGMILATRDVRVARRWADIGAIIDRGKVTLYPDLESAIDQFSQLEPVRETYNQLQAEEDVEDF